MTLPTEIRFAAAALCVALMLAAPAHASTKKGDKYLKLGQKAEGAKDYDAALSYYEKALTEDPKEPAYLLADQHVRVKASEGHISAGKQFQKQQKLEDGLLEFQKAFLADPSSQIALQEIRNTTAMIKERATLPAGTPVLTPAQKAREAVERRIQSLEGPPQLHPINDQITSLKMNNQPAHVLYETVGKLAGINLLFDPTGYETAAGKTYNLDLTNATLDEALDYIALLSHTFWKPVSRNAIFITQESDLKRQEYQDEVVKVFYIQNATTPNEFTEIFNGVRTATSLNKGLFQVASQNAIVIRASPDNIALVEKVIHDLDKPKSEVVVDVIVMEVSKQKMMTLGAALAGATGGLNIPIQFTPRNPILFGNTGTGTGTTTGTTTGATTGTSGTGTTTTTGTDTSGTGTTLATGTGTDTGTSASSSYIALSKVGHISSSDFSTTLPGALVQALLTDTSSRVLYRPQVRATDGGEAVLKIGSKIPYVSGSLNSVVATSGATPYATTQFQQVDVGVNIDMKPRVNGPEDVSMHIKVEISNVIAQVSIAGIDQPEIGQRVNEADIRMKDGEVTVIGGLSEDSNSLTVAGIPGVANIPVLGYLFGTRTKDRQKDDILVALIPHIVRGPDLSAMGEEGVASGTDRVTRVIRRQAPAQTQAAPTTTPMGSVPVASPPQLTPTPNVVPNAQPPGQKPAPSGVNLMGPPIPVAPPRPNQ